MAQHIGVSKFDESNNLIEQYDINLAAIHEALSSDAKSKDDFPWLSSIDEYGVTTFNALQVAHVRDEIKNLSNNFETSELLNPLKRLDQVLSNLDRHEYVKLIGD